MLKIREVRKYFNSRKNVNFWKIYTFENVNFSRTRKNENLEIIQEYIQYVGQLEYNYKKI